MHYYQSPLVAAKFRLRKALREMLVCAAIVGLLFAILGGQHRWDGGSTFALVFVSVLFGPAVWAVYRLARFITGL